jgi:hypothetical protein
MTLPTGTISMSQVAAELGVGAAGLSLNAGNVRTLAGVPSGAVSMNHLRGKSNLAPLTCVVNDQFAYRGTNNTGVVSASTTAVAGGGSGGYSYAWTFLSGTSFGDKPAVATPSFSYSCAPGSEFTGVYRCTVTDSGGRTASDTCSITLGGYQM